MGGKYEKNGRVLCGTRPKYSSRGTEASSYPAYPYQKLSRCMNFAISQNISSCHRPGCNAPVRRADDRGNPGFGFGQFGFAVLAQGRPAFIGGDCIFQLLLTAFQGAN